MQVEKFADEAAEKPIKEKAVNRLVKKEAHMTVKDKVDICSKEVLTLKDITILFDCKLSVARDIMDYIKANGDNRLVKAGTVHIEDYFKAYKVNTTRFNIFIENLSEVVELKTNCCPVCKSEKVDEEDNFCRKCGSRY